MAISRIKNWVALEVLTANDQNAEFNNIINAGVALISPMTANLDVNLKQLTNMRLEVQTATQAAAQGAGRMYWQSSEGTIHVDTGSLIARTPAITGIQEGFLLGTVNPSGVSGATTYGLIQAATPFAITSGVLTTSAPLYSQVSTGCTLSNDVGTPNTILDVAAGAWTSDDALVTNRVLMTLTAMTGTISSTWVVGTGQPKLDTGTATLSTWYHVFLIKRLDTSVTDILFSASATSPTMPANYTKKRRIGSFRLDTSVHITLFKQLPLGEFLWDTPPGVDVSTSAPGTAAITVTSTALPLGVITKALLRLNYDMTGANGVASITPLAVADVAPSGTVSPLADSGSTSGTMGTMNGPVQVWTNTSAQYRYRISASGGSVVVRIQTLGWIDPRGRDD